MTNHISKWMLLIIITLASMKGTIAKSPNEDNCIPPPSPVNTTSNSAQTICSGKFTTLSVSGTGTIGWYNLASGGTYLGGGNTLITSTLTSNTTYYAQDSTCDVSPTRTAITVTILPLPNVTASSSSASICYGSMVTLASNNASTYIWNPGGFVGSSVTIAPATFTTYTVTGTDGSGCSKTSTISINVYPVPTVGTSATATTICAGASTTINGTGATFYNWQPGTLSGSSQTLFPAVTTTYTVTGVDFGTLCSNTSTRTIAVNPAPPVSITATNNIICNGTSTTLTASNASSYLWNPGALTGSVITTSPSATTTYTVTGTNSGTGCTSKSTITINVNTLPAIAASASSTSICIGNSSTLSSTGGLSYTWLPGGMTGNSVVVSPTATTTYTVTGVNGNSCSNTSIITINVNSLPLVDITASQSIICSGGSAQLTGTGANTYSWQPLAANSNSINVTPGAATTYTVTGTNSATGCVNTATKLIQVNSLPTVGFTLSSSPVCSGTSVTLSGTGANTYTWNPGTLSGNSVIVNPTATISYTVTGTNSSTGCSNTATNTINVNSLPNVVTSAPNPSICIGSSSTITGNGATSYTWEPGNLSGTSITVSPTSTTVYTVTGTNSTTGCSKTNTRTITVNPLPTTGVTASANTVCAGSPTTLTATGANSYTWTPGGLSGSPITVSPFGNTTYVVTGTSSSGCTKTASILITVNGLSNVNTTTTSSSICPGNSTMITATGSTTYTWQPGSLTGSSVVVSPLTTTVYTVTGTNTTGCTKTATRTITVLSCNSTLNLKLFIEGYYTGAGAMESVMQNQLIAGATSTMTDSITVELRQTTSPYNVANSIKTILNTNGTATCNFPISGLYYIAVKHRNGLQTWSANPVSLTVNPLLYDFSISASQAYGNNQSDLGGGIFGFYSGELNADENIDLLDLGILETDISNFQSGYFASDINGDGNVDLLDSPTIELNVNNFIFSVHP